jgi:hypothetical protein
MLIRKPAVPLINEKLLSQAVHCYIVTAGISDAGFEFVRSRIPPKCKIDLITGLDNPSSPQVLHKVLRHYQERITVKIYTRNVLHANMLMIELPYRKSVAFVGSGTLSLEGLKDYEELFWKVSDPKEIESLLSWFTGYYEFGSPLTEELIQEYEAVYPEIRRREIMSREEKDVALSAAGIRWDVIRFGTQLFTKEDFHVLSPVNWSVSNEQLRNGRNVVLDKLRALRDSLTPSLATHKLFPIHEGAGGLSIAEIHDHEDHRIKELCIGFSSNPNGIVADGVRMEAGLAITHFFVRIRKSVRDPEVTVPDLAGEVRAELFSAVSKAGSGHYFSLAGVRRPAESFSQANALWDFTQADRTFSDLLFEKRWTPGDLALAAVNIDATVISAFKNLLPVATAIREV